MDEFDSSIDASSGRFLSLLHRISQSADKQFEAMLGDGVATVRQVQLLLAIEADDGASQAKLSQATGIDRSTMTDMIRRLSKRHLITRRRSASDARTYVVKLTKEGRAELARWRQALESVENGLLQGLSRPQQSSLIGTLQSVLARSGEGGRESDISVP